MAISHLARRLLSPSTATTTAKLFPGTSFSNPHAYARNPLLLLDPHRRFSASPNTTPNPAAATAAPEAAPAPETTPLESMKHQEIEGPTVERDLSPLADEARAELDALRRAAQRLSASLAILGGTHLAAGAWIASGAAPVGVESAALVQGVAAFAFPFTAALVLRRVIKPVAFFQKMEANGRLQVLTLCLQASKNVNLMMLRTRVVAISCALGVSVGSVATILMR
ncbi:uncharacterized protein LOC119317668 [Triticum dicoccoides]|uniref:uncharacterized protein LOC119317668 n=1 Tax=Triticum dicoccoides TaxID=85692 RepID=UPI000E7BCFE1|nr:uncharacterized protein LOC119317668 [Triticum dicoccoides]